MPRLIATLACAGTLQLASLPAAAGGTSARRDATRLIVEKLERQSGEGWQRSGQYFLWHYSFSSNGCELTSRRQAVDGGETVVQRLPMADLVPVWNGGGSIGLFCQSTTDCIALDTLGGAKDTRNRIGQTQILAPEPDDLPKLADAFRELHRLCDDAYSVDE